MVILDNAIQFLPFSDSTALQNKPDLLRSQASQDGYLFFRGLLDQQSVLRVREVMLNLCSKHRLLSATSLILSGEIQPGVCLIEGQSDAWFAYYADVLRQHELYELAWHPALISLFETLFEDIVLPHSCSIFRTVFPGSGAFAKPAHQDFRYVGGTHETWTAWIPCGDCPQELGGIALLSGSHQFGELPVQPTSWGKTAVIPDGLQWHYSEMECGDVLLFSSLTVHRGMPNTSTNRLRLSADFRYQSLSNPIRLDSLLPHLKFLTWEEVYQDWDINDLLRYYWRKMQVKYASV